MDEMSSIDAMKAELRRRAVAVRDALPGPERAAAAAAIAARDLPVDVFPGAIVSGFSPLKGEINPLPLMRRLALGGVQLALPVTPPRGEPLRFRSYAWGDALSSGVWGIRDRKSVV